MSSDAAVQARPIDGAAAAHNSIAFASRLDDLTVDPDMLGVHDFDDVVLSAVA